MTITRTKFSGLARDEEVSEDEGDGERATGVAGSGGG